MKSLGISEQKKPTLDARRELMEGEKIAFTEKGINSGVASIISFCLEFVSGQN